MNFESDAEELLYKLFYAIDNANISSWQTTHYWSKELEAVRKYFQQKRLKDESEEIYPSPTHFSVKQIEDAIKTVKLSKERKNDEI